MWLTACNGCERSRAGTSLALMCPFERAWTSPAPTYLPPEILCEAPHEQIADDIKRYRDAGLTYLVLEPRARHATEFTNQIEQLANQVWPRL